MSGYSRDCITVTMPGWDDTLDSSDTYTLTGVPPGNLTIGGSSNAAIGGVTVPWVTTTGTSMSSGIGIGEWANHASTKIRLNGPDADIEINGESLKDVLKNIEQRLNILKPNPELESEWEELRVLGDAYRKLEADIQAKMKTWDAIAKKD